MKIQLNISWYHVAFDNNVINMLWKPCNINFLGLPFANMREQIGNVYEVHQIHTHTNKMATACHRFLYLKNLFFRSPSCMFSYSFLGIPGNAALFYSNLGTRSSRRVRAQLRIFLQNQIHYDAEAKKHTRNASVWQNELNKSSFQAQHQIKTMDLVKLNSIWMHIL